MGRRLIRLDREGKKRRYRMQREWTIKDGFLEPEELFRRVAHKGSE